MEKSPEKYAVELRDVPLPEVGPEDVLRLVRGFTGTQDDPLATTLRSLANRFGVPEAGVAAGKRQSES